MKKFILAVLFLGLGIVQSHATACTRWWVGGGSSGTWSATGPTNWGDASNTQDNASVPTTTDLVCFDGIGTGASNSTLNAAIQITDLDFTGYSNTFIHATATTLTITGNLTMSPTMTYSPATSTSLVTMEGSGNINLTSAGKHFTSLTFGGTAGGTGTRTLQDALFVGNTLSHTRGNINTNSMSVTAGAWSASSSNTRGLIPCGSTIALSGTGTVWNAATSTNYTFNSCVGNPWTISVTDTSVTSKTFAGGSKIYSGFSVAGSASNTFLVTGANTFGSLSLASPLTVTWPSSNTNTFGSIACTGSAGNVITFNASTPGTQATLSQKTGIVSCDYLNLTDSASNWVAFYAGANSTNTSNNSGWIFSAAPTSARSIKLSGYTTI